MASISSQIEVFFRKKSRYHGFETKKNCSSKVVRESFIREHISYVSEQNLEVQVVTDSDYIYNLLSVNKQYFVKAFEYTGILPSFLVSR